MQALWAGLGQVLVSVLTSLGSYLVARASEYWAKKRAESELEKAKDESHTAIDARLETLKKAYLEANDGTKATPEQRAALIRAISDFIRNPDGSGL